MATDPAAPISTKTAIPIEKTWMSQIPLLSDEVCSFEEGVSLSTMDTEERDQELVEQVLVHLISTTHPPGCDENRKRVICNKAKKFKLKDGELHVYHKQKQNRKVNCSCVLVHTGNTVFLVDPYTIAGQDLCVVAFCS